MNLPEDFQFSQSSLQDFADCRRRFLLRHIWRLSWPAIETEPILEHERYLQQGAAFHRFAQQLFVGIPADRLADSMHDPQLRQWWDSFVQVAGELKELQRSAGWELYPEISLSATLSGARLIAKYDLLAVSPQGEMTIYDWKTSQVEPKGEWLGKRLQSKVYPYLLVQAGAHLNKNQPVQPEQVEMTYWFANHPQQSVSTPYSRAAFQVDEAYLSALIETIRRLGESEFSRTPEERRCAFCTFRSLCNRGISAGSLSEWQYEIMGELEAQVNLDFEQIAEIEF